MKAKTKKVLTGTAALVLTAALSIGGTFAYLTRLTEKRANNFTFASKGLNATLTEPEWDGIIDYEYVDDSTTGNRKYKRPVYKKDGDDEVYGYYTEEETDDDGNVTRKKKHPLKYTPEKLEEFDKNDSWDEDKDPGLKKWYKKIKDKKPEGSTVDYDDYERPDKSIDEDLTNDNEPNYGYLEAQNMIPGGTAKKNPFITNTGDLNEWVAVQVSFLDKDGNLITETSELWSTITSVIRVNWPTKLTTGTVDGSGAWYYKGTAALGADSNNYHNQMIFYYDKALDKTEAGKKTSELFTTVSVIGDASNEQIQKLESLGGFTIYVEGYAVQESKFVTVAGGDTGAKQWVTSNSATFGAITTPDNIFGIVPAANPVEDTSTGSTTG